MKIKVFAIVIVVFLVLSSLMGIFDFEKTDSNAVAAATLYVGGTGGGNYTVIQWAIDNASAGDTVFVYNGTYNESIVVNKSISLIGQDMFGTIIHGIIPEDTNATPPYNQTRHPTGGVIYVNASNVLIKGFTVTNGTDGSMDAGIKLQHVKDCTIMNNNVSDNKQYGIIFQRCTNITIKNNFISSNGFSGIYLYISGNNTISDNLLVKNMIFLSNSINNIVENNRIEGSEGNYHKNGIHILYSSNGNTVNNNYISNCTQDGIAVLYSNDNNISNNEIINCTQYYWTNSGISIQYSHENTFYMNEISGNQHTGIYSLSSNKNLILFNKIYDNGIGLHLSSSSSYPGDKIYLNELVNNIENIAGSSGIRNWNSSQPMGYIYNNTNFTSYLGNYWDDYNGTDSDGDGIGDTPYDLFYYKANVTEQDIYPLMEPVENYTIIPTSIKVDLDASSANSTNMTVWLNVREGVLHAQITGILNGTIKFTNLHIVTINSGYFAGNGFFIANWHATIEGNQYHGKWQGMLFNKTDDSKTYLKGTLSGGLKGITDGYFNNSNTSGKVLLYNSTWTISHIGSNLIFAQLNVGGIVTNLTSKNFTSEINILQLSCKGNATGYYNGSLDVVLTHVRINNKTNKYHGHGFSFITYTSIYGTGQGWTFDHMSTSQKGITKLTGFFTEPLWGLVFGKIDETGSTTKLTLSIMRVDLGLPPRAILTLDVWGWKWLSPGQTGHYFVEFSNYGLKGVNDTEIVLQLPKNMIYISNTCGGTYNASSHEVTWQYNISAKSKKTVSVKCKAKWGLSQGTKLVFHGYIRDYLQNFTYATDSFTVIIRTAKDPNAKYGTEGNVSAGQTLNYTIEFENEGAGIAFGVYFTDQLSEYLNDSSLQIGPVRNTKDNSVIAPPGSYNPATRTITWLVGELGPKEGGFANISIRINDDAATGTEILNYGTVFFPSVPEVTKTNGVVSIVNINQGPNAYAGNNLVVKTLENIVFDGSGSTDPDGSIVNYTWDFGDGEFGYGITTSHSYSDNGNYKVKLTVEDDGGEFDTHEITVQVQNRRPTATLEADITELFTNYQVNFDASQSTDLDGSVVDYRIDFGDGTDSGWVQTSSIKHFYTEGTILNTAKLTVRDDDGALSTNLAQLEILVKNRAPKARLSADKLEGKTFEDITFNGGTSDDQDGQVAYYYYDFGDGQYSTWNSEPSATHQYADGTKEYTVQLLVKDDDGEISDTAEIIIKINNRAPKAAAGADRTVDTNQIIDFNGKSSTDQDGVISSYGWNFGDGSTGTGKAATHTYSKNGEYTVTLTVTDDDGATDVDTCKVTVNNVKPVAGFNVNPEEGDLTTIFEFSSTSYDTDGSISVFQWNFGDGSTSDDAYPTHRYNARGTHTVALVVKDDDGAYSDVFQKEITINNLPPVASASSSAESAEVGESITFFGTDSYDTDGAITNFKWVFGDDQVGTGNVVQHSYKAKGTYTVTLVVIDDASDSDTTTLKIEITESVPDFDGDSIPDHLDPDDDNDGITDVWELKYELDPMNPSDANTDPDNDDLTNLEEFLNETEPNNPDTDGEGLLDGEELKIFMTNPNNPDTDGDELDDYNDPYPNDPLLPKKDIGEVAADEFDYQPYMILGVIIILIIIILALVLRKRRPHGQVSTPYNGDPALREVRDQVLADTSGQNLKIARDSIKSKLESSQAQGEISVETYKYINEQILHEEAEIEE